MDSKEVAACLASLSGLLARRNVVGEIVLFGGAAMVLAHKARVSTKDVGAVFAPKDVINHLPGSRGNNAGLRRPRGLAE